jgi:hypothetical protein
MINQQLLTYISNQQDSGIDDEIIKDNLLSAGWREEDVDEGFQAVNSNLDSENSPAAHQQVRKEAVTKSHGEQGVSSTDESFDASSDDLYREPIEEEDATGPAAKDNMDASMNKGKGVEADADDASAASDTQMNEDDTEEPNTRETSDSESSPAEAAGESDEVDQVSADEELDDIGKRENPLDSHEEMKKLADDEEGDSGDSGPMAIRTFHKDREQAGGKAQDKNQTDSPAKQARSVKSSDGVRVKRSQPQSGQIKDEDLDKAVQSVAATQGTKEDIEKSQIDSPRNQMESVRKDTSGKQEGMTKPDQSGPQSTADGKRRFSAEKKSGQKTMRGGKRKSKKEKGSGSKFVSILIFILILAVVGGGAAYAYITYFQTSAPEVTSEQMMNSLSDAGTFDFRIMIESAESGQSDPSRLTIEGVMDLNTDTETQSYYIISDSAGDFSPIRAVLPEVENIASVPAIQRETIRNVLLTPEFFTLGEFQTSEQLGQSGTGFSTNRYGVTVNPGQLVSEYAVLYQALFDSAVSQDVMTGLQATVAAFEPVQGQAWLDQESNVPYQITLIGKGAEGQDMQINFQFKNHGYTPETTPTYEPRSTQQALSAIFAPEQNTVAQGGQNTPDEQVDDEQVEIDDENDTDTNTNDDDIATSSDNSTNQPDTTEPQMSQADMRRYDRLRINDIQQLEVALQIYANQNESFPSSLSRLVGSQSSILSSIPRDPLTSAVYPYSISGESDRYHVGATLQLLLRTDAPNDANFNSASQGYLNGFNGAGTSCGSTSLPSMSTCYDVTASSQ